VIFTAKPLPVDPVYPADQIHPTGAPLEAGDTHQIVGMVDPPITQAQWAEITNEAGSVRLKVYGFIRYDCGFKREMRVGFGYEHNPMAVRFGGPTPSVMMGVDRYNFAD